MMNKIIPHSNPCWTFLVWLPQYEASRVTSRHQHNIFNGIRIRAVSSINGLFMWNQWDMEYIRIRPANDAVRGQGLM